MPFVPPGNAVASPVSAHIQAHQSSSTGRYTRPPRLETRPFTVPSRHLNPSYLACRYTRTRLDETQCLDTSSADLFSPRRGQRNLTYAAMYLERLIGNFNRQMPVSMDHINQIAVLSFSGQVVNLLRGQVRAVAPPGNDPLPLYLLTSRHTNPLSGPLRRCAPLPRLEMRRVCGGSLTSRHFNPSSGRGACTTGCCRAASLSTAASSASSR